jgi:RluA family pseudouridine synthase
MFPQGRHRRDGSVEASVVHWRREIDAGRVEAIPASIGDFRQLVVARHVHEQPIVATECSVLHEDEKLLVVSKPAGMPTLNEIQGVGFNTALGLLQHRLGDACKLVPMHRLDKPVSGVLIFVKTVEGQQVRDPLVRKIQKHITQHKVQKTYVARVLGSFSEAPVSCTAPLQWCEGSDRGTASVSYESGKASETRFTLIQREGSTSLVSCVPITGRPHQIRAHLQHLGHPIANDEQYGGMRQLASAAAVYTDDSEVGCASGALLPPPRARASSLFVAELVQRRTWPREPVGTLYIYIVSRENVNERGVEREGEKPAVRHRSGVPLFHKTRPLMYQKSQGTLKRMLLDEFRDWCGECHACLGRLSSSAGAEALASEASESRRVRSSAGAEALASEAIMRSSAGAEALASEAIMRSSASAESQNRAESRETLPEEAGSTEPRVPRAPHARAGIWLHSGIARISPRPPAESALHVAENWALLRSPAMCLSSIRVRAALRPSGDGGPPA